MAALTATLLLPFIGACAWKFAISRTPDAFRRTPDAFRRTPDVPRNSSQCERWAGRLQRMQEHERIKLARQPRALSVGVCIRCSPALPSKRAPHAPGQEEYNGCGQERIKPARRRRALSVGVCIRCSPCSKQACAARARQEGWNRPRFPWECACAARARQEEYNGCGQERIKPARRPRALSVGVCIRCSPEHAPGQQCLAPRNPPCLRAISVTLHA